MFLSSCIMAPSIKEIFPKYESMFFNSTDGIDNLKLNEPVKIEGYVGVLGKSKGLFSSKKLSHSKNLSCIALKPLDITKYKLKNKQKVIIAGIVTKNRCSNIDLICLSACQDYIFYVEHIQTALSH